MQTAVRRSTAASRLLSLLSGVLLSAVVLGSVPSFEHTTELARDLRPVVEDHGADRSEPAPLDQSVVVAYLSREWRLGRQYASQVVSAVMSAALRHDIDPLLLMAVAATESSFVHAVGNPGGGADPMKPYGIMQVAGRYHPDKFPEGEVRPTTVGQNVDIGAQVLKEYLATERGNERRALLRYNGSLNASDKYFQKVTRFKRELLQGLRREKSLQSETDTS